MREMYVNELKLNLSESERIRLTSLLELIDTALVKIYAVIDHSKILKFLQTDQTYCSLSESSKVLKSKHLYSELIFLLKVREQHRRALELLFSLAQNDDVVISFSNIVDYLSELGNKDAELVLFFTKKLLPDHPQLALRVFNRMDQSNLIPVSIIVPFLEHHCKSNLIPFYEHLVYDFKVTEVSVHNALCKEFIHELSHLIESSQFYLPNSSRLPAGTEGGDLGHLRNRFLNFLMFSKFYQAEYILSTIFPKDCPLYEEKALLYAKFGNHEEVLAIYIYKLSNIQIAEDYCKQVYDRSSENIFLMLFSVLIYPPAKYEKLKSNENFAMSILKKWSGFVDPLEALEIIDQNSSLKNVSPFLVSVLDHLASKSRDLSVQRNLVHLNSLKIMSHLVQTQKKSICVDLNTTCSICNKRVGTSAIAYLPNNTVSHFHCNAKQQSS
ncbi:hypothetical protein GEMRC1_007053 [Eukaryota sp. GEM-RC1]